MVLTDSVAVRLDGKRLERVLDPATLRLEVTLPNDLSPGKHRLSVHDENRFKNSVLNPDFAVVVREDEE